MTPSNTVISVSRKPLALSTVAANVLDHGTGALNINATRIRTGSAEPDSGAMFYKNRGLPMPENRQNYFQGEDQKVTSIPLDGGRWPANLILGHKPECVHLGSKVVESTSGIMADHHRRNAPMGYMTGDMRGVKPTCYVNPDGTEVVESWECVEGCAVAELDRQSGMSTSAGGRFSGANAFGQDSGWNAHNNRPTEISRPTDTGGASRYFKQVGEFNVSTDIPDDLLSYLTTLITPTHVGGETLIALDIEAVDWASLPDGRYHGLIARGEPTAEQTEHMWRVVKPGAHVLLIAPDECPTGHHGACALEDQGFEIRDAILWVREAGGLHYVPKTNSRERNAGCEALAAKRKGAPIYELTESTLEDEALVESIVEALQEAGVAGEVVDALVEGGLPKNLVPAEYKRAFQKRVGAGKYGNNHPCVKPKEIMARLLWDIPKGAVVMDPFMGCYDESTEVLTREGWKYFPDVTDDDEILTQSTSGLLEYARPEARQAYEYNGEMVRFKSRSTDLLVTPNHNMWVQSHADFCASRPARMVQADMLDQNLYRIPCGGTYEPESDLLSREMMYLIGLYVTEGYFDSKGYDDVVICQNKGAKWDEMVANIASLSPRSYGDRRFKIRLSASEMQFLRENCGTSKYRKFLSPTILKNRHIDALFDAMVLGDGHRTPTGQVQYGTVSPRLANGFQELCLKLGWDSTLIVRPIRDARKDGLLIKGTAPELRVLVRRATSKKIDTTKHVSRVPYDGMVYCLTVPNHTMFIRRNGFTSWCGNSGSTGLACLETGHDFIGIEREPDYLEIADARARYWQGSVKGWLDTHIDSEAQPVVKTDVVDERGVFDLFD